METIEPGQEYEIVVDFRHLNHRHEKFYSELSQMGTSFSRRRTMYVAYSRPTEKRTTPPSTTPENAQSQRQ